MADDPKKGKGKMSLRVDEALRDFEQQKFPSDDEFGRGDLQDLSGPERFAERQKSHDEVVIDELLASVPTNRGYYLKLMKEVMPNQYEFKMRINHYDQWADLQYEIAKIVTEMTRKSPTRWGSGRYKTVVWNDGGMRGEKYPDSEFLIDAGEIDAGSSVAAGERIEPHAYLQAQLGNMQQFMESVKGFMPPQADPAKTTELLGNAYMKGMEGKQGESNNMVLMMQTMMSSMMNMVTAIIAGQKQNGNGNGNGTVAPEQTLERMMGIMDRFGVIPKIGMNGGQGTVFEGIKQLKELGLEPFKQNDFASQVTAIKAIGAALGDLGQPERPSMGEKLLDSAGQALPKVLEIIANSSKQQPQYVLRQLPNGQVVQVPVNAMGMQPQPGQLPMAGAGTGAPGIPFVQTPEGPVEHIPSGDEGQMMMFGGDDFVKAHPQAPEREPQPISPFQSQPTAPIPPSQPASPPPTSVDVHPILLDIKKAIEIGDDSFFAVISGLFQAAEGGMQLMEGLATDQTPKSVLIQIIHGYGGQLYAEPQFQPKLDAYADRFISWLKISYKQYVQAQQQQQQTPVQKPQAAPNSPPVIPSQSAAPQIPQFQARCTACGAIYDYTNEDEYLREMDHICGEEQGGGQTCPGILEPVQIVKA